MVRKQTFVLAAITVVAFFASAHSLLAQESLTHAQFLQKVWNYEVHKDALVLESKVPVVLDFYATWCGPCRMIAPELKALQEEYKDRIKVYKIDVDNERNLAAVFGANALPTVYFLKNGSATYIQGYRTKAELKQIVDNFLLNPTAGK